MRTRRVLEGGLIKTAMNTGVEPKFCFQPVSISSVVANTLVKDLRRLVEKIRIGQVIGLNHVET